MAGAMEAQSSVPNSGHSVATTTAWAPRAASATLGAASRATVAGSAIGRIGRIGVMDAAARSRAIPPLERHGIEGGQAGATGQQRRGQAGWPAIPAGHQCQP